jgi:hypothetical protein
VACYSVWSPRAVRIAYPTLGGVSGNMGWSARASVPDSDRHRRWQLRPAYSSFAAFALTSAYLMVGSVFMSAARLANSLVLAASPLP